MSSNGRTAKPGRAEDPTRPQLAGFEWRDRGLYAVKESAGQDDSGNPKTPEVTFISPPFSIPGLVRTEASMDWRLLILWHDLDGTQHQEPIPFELLTGEGAELARIFAQGGHVLPPDLGVRRHLLRYLCGAASRVSARVRMVDSPGWNGEAFIMPNGEVHGQADGAIWFSGELTNPRSWTPRGTLAGWKEGVARLAVNNPRLAFALSCAFAGPLLGLVRPDGGGGFNLMGASSRGKTTCLECAASVWGRPDPLLTWRGTSNGLEGIAAARNDGFLVLDEMSQVEPKDAGSVAYMLANGSAKARANKDGGARGLKQWRLVFLSSGEQGIEDKLSEDGKRARAGQEVRVPDIPCPPSGMFRDAHEQGNLGGFAEHLKRQAREHYGHAARAFLDGLCQRMADQEQLQSGLLAMEGAWLDQSLKETFADAQVRRVAGRFALVAVAGELAQSMGILPWPEGEASSAARECFRAWLDGRGYTGASEDHKGIEAIIGFLEKYGQSRFDDWGKNNDVSNRAGTRRPAQGVSNCWDYYITGRAWAEACAGLNPQSVARICIEAGILETDGDGRASRTIKTPHHGKPRFYVIRARGLEALAGSDGDAA